MANIRQSILVRTDLNLPNGLLAAQISHIHFELFRKRLKANNCSLQLFDTNSDGGDAGGTIDEDYLDKNDLINWIASPYLFIHQVPHGEALEYFKYKALEAKLPVIQWQDVIYQNLSDDLRVPFHMPIGLAIGPADSDRIKMVIGTLPLL